MLVGDDPTVRCAAAEACVSIGRTREGLGTLSAAVLDPDSGVALQAATHFIALGGKARPAVATTSSLTWSRPSSYPETLSCWRS